MNEHDRGQVAASAAEIYEQFFVPALFAEWPARVLEAAGVQAGETVLDVACGTGVLARKAAELVGPEGAVVGVDVNEGMVAVAQQKAPHITWKVGPAEQLPFEEHTFDRVVSQFGLMFFEDQVQAIQEMARVVGPNGSIAIAVWDTLAATPGFAALAQILDELFGPEVASSLHAPFSLGDKTALTALFARAGIEDVTIQTITGTTRFASIEDWIYTEIKGWTLAEMIDDAAYERLRQCALEKLARFVQADGSVAFDSPGHIVASRK